jgi:5-methylcytosine-specific restriction endonuclease McrA
MSYIPDALRRLVEERAGYLCEYCMIHARYTLKRHEVDHVHATKHGGLAVAENLCYCCFECNRHKGSDLASIDPETQEIVLLYHPRRDRWHDHFALEGAVIKPLTPVGRTTARLLHFNTAARIEERELLIKLKRYSIPD